MRSIFLTIAVLAVIAASAVAQGPAAPYQRTRSGSDSWGVRGGYAPSWHGGSGGWGGGFYPPLYAPLLVAGSWYQRPYPYHFDYYRYRWGGDPVGPYGHVGVERIPAADCPCLEAAKSPEAVAAP